MDPQKLSCAILADRHLGFAEGMRGLLASAFQTVYIVADIEALNEGTERLLPALVVLDLAVPGAELSGLIGTLRERSPETRVIVLSMYDQPSVAELALDAGADGVVLKHCAGTEFLSAIDTVASGAVYVSPGFGLNAITSR